VFPCSPRWSLMALRSSAFADPGHYQATPLIIVSNSGTTCARHSGLLDYSFGRGGLYLLLSLCDHRIYDLRFTSLPARSFQSVHCSVIYVRLLFAIRPRRSGVVSVPRSRNVSFGEAARWTRCVFVHRRILARLFFKRLILGALRSISLNFPNFPDADFWG